MFKNNATQRLNKCNIDKILIFGMIIDYNK
jgi:hypothetical protein